MPGSNQIQRYGVFLPNRQNTGAFFAVSQLVQLPGHKLPVARRHILALKIRFLWKVNLEARGGIEPPIRVLQTLALPLGYRASAISVIVLF